MRVRLEAVDDNFFDMHDDASVFEGYPTILMCTEKLRTNKNDVVHRDGSVQASTVLLASAMVVTMLPLVELWGAPFYEPHAFDLIPKPQIIGSGWKSSHLLYVIFFEMKATLTLLLPLFARTTAFSQKMATNAVPLANGSMSFDRVCREWRCKYEGT